MDNMTEEKKIRSAAGEAALKAKADRDRYLGEMREYLDSRQREAAFEEPSGSFKTKLPLDAMGGLSAAEREELHAFEEQAFHRRQEQARLKDSEKRYWTAAGGDGDRFERRWSEGGEEEAVARRAREIRERAENSAY